MRHYCVVLWPCGGVNVIEWSVHYIWDLHGVGKAVDEDEDG